MSRSIMKPINGKLLGEELKKRNVTFVEASLELGYNSRQITNGIRINKLSTAIIQGLRIRYSIDPSLYVMEDSVPNNTPEVIPKNELSPEMSDSLYKIIYSAVYAAVKQAWSE